MASEFCGKLKNSYEALLKLSDSYKNRIKIPGLLEKERREFIKVREAVRRQMLEILNQLLSAPGLSFSILSPKKIDGYKIEEHKFRVLRELTDSVLPMHLSNGELYIKTNLLAENPERVADVVRILKYPGNMIRKVTVFDRKIDASAIKMLSEAIKSENCNVDTLVLQEAGLGPEEITEAANLVTLPDNGIKELTLLQESPISLDSVRRIIMAVEHENANLSDLVLGEFENPEVSGYLLTEMMEKPSMSALKLGILSNGMTIEQLKEWREFGDRVNCIRFPERQK